MSAPQEWPKVYLGDGAYVTFDGYQLILTTSNGYRDTNTIALEPAVYSALVRYVAALRAEQEPCLEHPENLKRECEACLETDAVEEETT